MPPPLAILVLFLGFLFVFLLLIRCARNVPDGLDIDGPEHGDETAILADLRSRRLASATEADGWDWLENPKAEEVWTGSRDARTAPDLGFPTDPADAELREAARGWGMNGE